MKTTIKPLFSETGEELLSHYRVTVNKYGQEVAVPVVDVRDGPAYRMLAYQTMAGANRSKYMNYNQYHGVKIKL